MQKSGCLLVRVGTKAPTAPSSLTRDLEELGNVKIKHDGPRFCKNVIPVPGTVIAGYRKLHIQEAKYTLRALEAMPEAVANWYGYLTLYDRTMRREHDWGEDDPSDAYWSWSVRLNLASGAAATAKLTLDAALAGYYSPAYGLLRHLAETWEQMVYLRLNEQAARQWFSPDGVVPARVPSKGTVLGGIRKRGKAEVGLLNNLNLVEHTISALNDGAHPSGLMMVQVSTDTASMRQLGANFNRELLGSVMSWGTVFIALLLREIEHIVPSDEQWRAEFDALGEDRRRWHAATLGDALGKDDDVSERSR